MKQGVVVNARLTIPGDEIGFRFLASGGPGGQHANKSATKVVLEWDVINSRVLGPRQRARLRERLRNRIDAAGVLRMASHKHRSQRRNRQEVLERLGRVVDDALRTRPKRIATGPTRSSTEKRLRAKKHRAETKRMRRYSGDDQY